MKPFARTTSVYSESEVASMQKFKGLKQVVFAPLLRLLTLLRITPTMLSVTSGFVALTSAAFSVYTGTLVWMVGGMWIHMLMDGLDGALARFQKNESTRGSLIDVTFDQLGVTIVAVALSMMGGLDVVPTALFVFLYTCTNVFAFFLGYINQPYRFIIRPRLYFFAAITVDFFYPTALTTPVTWVCIGFMTIFSVQGWWRTKNFLS